MGFRPIEADYPLILASNSPRRRELLHGLKIPFEICPSSIQEQLEGVSPSEYSLTLSIAKAEDAFQKKRGYWVLGADTVVVLRGRILGKPVDQEDARRMLVRLSNRTHKVITSFAILNPIGRLAHVESVVTSVRFKELSEEEIWAYIATGEPMDKAGAYGIQGIGSFMVERIEGSYSNVVGLPVFELVRALRKVGCLNSFPLSSSASRSRIG